MIFLTLPLSTYIWEFPRLVKTKTEVASFYSLLLKKFHFSKRLCFLLNSRRFFSSSGWLNTFHPEELEKLFIYTLKLLSKESDGVKSTFENMVSNEIFFMLFRKFLAFNLQKWTKLYPRQTFFLCWNTDFSPFFFVEKKIRKQNLFFRTVVKR